MRPWNSSWAPTDPKLTHWLSGVQLSVQNSPHRGQRVIKCAPSLHRAAATSPWDTPSKTRAAPTAWGLCSPAQLARRGDHRICATVTPRLPFSLNSPFGSQLLQNLPKRCDNGFFSYFQYLSLRLYDFFFLLKTVFKQMKSVLSVTLLVVQSQH